MNDALMTDDLAELLSQFPDKDLHGIVSIMKASTSLSIFPAARAYEAHQVQPGGDLRSHVAEIAGEILWWGSNDLQRQIGWQPDWRAVVVATAQQVGVKPDYCGSSVAVWRIERQLVIAALTDWEAMDPQRRADSVGEAGGTLGALLPGGIGAVGSAIARFGTSKLAALLPAKLAAGAAIGATMVPVALALATAAWTAHELAGPAHRVLRPVALTIALTRFRLRDERAAAVFGDDR